MTRRWRQGEDVWIGGANRFLLRLTLRERVAMGDRNCPRCRSPSAHESAAGHRNGSRDQLLTTPAGDIQLRIPLFRTGSFFPWPLEPRRRVDRALWAVVMEAYVSASPPAYLAAGQRAGGTRWTSWWQHWAKRAASVRCQSG
jgi:hypothetical protein